MPGLYNLPSLLWGHEAAVSAAVGAKIPRLKPGEISAPIWLKFSINVPAALPLPSSGTCADLHIDTAYIVKYTDMEIILQYILSNKGNAPLEVAGNTFQLAMNIYFISGAKLTRGAIPAGNAVVMLGRETLSGWLFAGQKLGGTAYIDLKNRTKFASNLLLELAPPSNLTECDRTNNTRWIEVKY